MKLPQSLTLQQFHDDINKTIVFADIMNGQNVWMGERSERDLLISLYLHIPFNKNELLLDFVTNPSSRNKNLQTNVIRGRNRSRSFVTLQKFCSNTTILNVCCTARPCPQPNKNR